MCCEVELAVRGVTLGRGERDDLAVRRVDRGECRGRSPVGITDRAGVDRALCGVLEPRVDRRIDLEATVLDGVEPVAVLELLLDEVEDVRLVDSVVLVSGVEVEGLGDRVIELARGYV